MPCCFIASKAAWARSRFSLSALVSHVPSFFLLSLNDTRDHIRIHNSINSSWIERVQTHDSKWHDLWIQSLLNHTFRSFSFSFLRCFLSSSSLIFSSLSSSSLSASFSASSSCLRSSSCKFFSQINISSDTNRKIVDISAILRNWGVIVARKCGIGWYRVEGRV